MIILYPRCYYTSAEVLCAQHRQEQLEESMSLLRTVCHRLISYLQAAQLESEMCKGDDEKLSAISRQLPTNVNLMGLKSRLLHMLARSAGPTIEDHPLVSQVASSRMAYTWLCAHAMHFTVLLPGEKHRREDIEWFYYNSPRPRDRGDPLPELSTICQDCLSGTLMP